MTEAPQQQTPLPPTSQSVPEPDSLQYWCYHCDKRVSIETLADMPDVICHECKNGFVESIAIAAAATAPPSAADQIDEPSLSNQFLQVLRLMAQAAREEESPPPPPSDPADPSDDDYLRIELEGWDNDGDDEVEVRDEEEEEGRDEDRSEDENEERENREEREEEANRRSHRDVLRLRLRDFATRAGSRRNRILDWAEILMGLEDHSIELRLQIPEVDDYFGNPEDYVDAAGYESLLQNLAEADAGARRGAPPASGCAIRALQTMKITSEAESLVCAICKDSVGVGEIAKIMPCSHGYHEDCIVPWLGSRNSCPVCRYELETDDPDYEEQRKKKQSIANAGFDGPSSSGSS